MSLAFLQHTVDRAVSYAGSYVNQLAVKLKAPESEVVTQNSDLQSETVAKDDSTRNILAELPSDLLLRVFSFVDGETLASVVPLVCKAWKAEVQKAAVWQQHVSLAVLEQLEPLAGLGGRISAPHLYLALKGRNLLRNPAFRRECNTQLLELGRPIWNKWKRDAWVQGHVSSQPVDWEMRPMGFSDPLGCVAGAPPPPVPYGGGGVRLGERVQQQLRGLLAGLGSSEAAEQLPSHSGPVPPTCIATTADWCEMMQLVDLDWELQRRGLTAAQSAHLLDSGLNLRFSVYVGSRADTLGQFCVGLILDEGGVGDAVPQMQSFVLRPSRHRYFSGRVRCTEQDRWQRFEYQVAPCPRGFRRAFVLLRGRRAATAEAPDPLPPFCGAKFACAELVFE